MFRLPRLAGLLAALVLGVCAHAEQAVPDALSDLPNFQINNDRMVSSGLPEASHFEALKRMGVAQVIDLIPGARGEEKMLVEGMGLAYVNIPVDWENPTVADFQQYVAAMQQSAARDGKVLTHCKLNWRGAVFTYLYRVTQLHEPDEKAKQDLLKIWEPNDTWQRFIDDVKATMDEPHHENMG